MIPCYVALFLKNIHKNNIFAYLPAQTHTASMCLLLLSNPGAYGNWLHISYHISASNGPPASELKHAKYMQLFKDKRSANKTDRFAECINQNQRCYFRPLIWLQQRRQEEFEVWQQKLRTFLLLYVNSGLWQSITLPVQLH